MNNSRWISAAKNRLSIEFSYMGFFNNYICFPIRKQLKKMGLGNKKLEKIREIKDIHKGKRCFVIATGPSLTLDDVLKLKNEYTIGINSIYKLYDQTDWRPTYYAMTDYRLVRKMLNGNKINIDTYATKRCFANIINEKEVYGNKTIYVENCWLDHAYHYGKSKKFKYEEDLALGVYDYYSITQECIIYAIYMGFKEIYLLGADNNYLGGRKHFIESKNDNSVNRKAAVLMQNANDIGYAIVKEIADAHKVKIYNVTRGGNLEIFQRKDLDTLLNCKTVAID